MLTESLVRRIKQHMKLPEGRQIWIWFDLLSIPQLTRDLQIKAISSLPSYTQLCTRCVARTHDDVCTHSTV